jgi:hypothetical protein
MIFLVFLGYLLTHREGDLDLRSLISLIGMCINNKMGFIYLFIYLFVTDKYVDDFKEIQSSNHVWGSYGSNLGKLNYAIHQVW